MKKNILFRVDGGSVYSVAMGHVYRCMRLARLLKSRGMNCSFLMKNYPEGIAIVRSDGFAVATMDSSIAPEQEAEITIGLALKLKAGIFIDLRSPKANIVSLANARNIETIVYEDYCSEFLEPTMLINPSLNAGKEKRYCSKKTRYLLGIDYLVLDPVIKDYRRKGFSPDINNIFLCFGGADPCNLSYRVINILLSEKKCFTMSLALGPAFGHLEKIKGIINKKDVERRVNIILNCNELYIPLAKSDAAITSGGTVAYEAVALCIPALALPSIHTEAETVSTLMRKGLIDGMHGDVGDNTDEVLYRKISQFIADRHKRESLYNEQIKHDLSGGVEKVVKHLIN